MTRALHKSLADESEEHLFALVSFMRANRGSLIPFIGAGLSAQFGFPTWRQFLVELAQDIRLDELMSEARSDEGLRLSLYHTVSYRLSTGRYLDAAQCLSYAYERDTFDAEVCRRFRVVEEHLASQSCAANQLPDLNSRLHITTNFDRILEGIFNKRNRTLEVVSSRSFNSLAVQSLRPKLLKLHGDVNPQYPNAGGRIITYQDYTDHYGHRASNPSTECVKRSLDVPRTLSSLASRFPFLFLGCSLAHDCPLAVLELLAKETLDTSSLPYHYAIIDAPEEKDLPARRKYLGDRRIRPIWYPSGRHESVGELLSIIRDAVRGRSKPPFPYWRNEGHVTEVRRSQVLEAIERKFGEYPVVNVYALSGFGKSYVARQFLEGESRQGIWIDCARAASLLEIFRTITETTSPSADGIPADVDNPSVISESVKEGLRSQVTALLGTGNYLIVLDNLEQAEISRGVGEWLTSLSFPARVLTTSISRLGLDQTRVAQVQLPEMPESEARELLNSAAERELTPAEWRGLEGVHHYPLLVNLACQHVRECVRLGLPIAGSWRKVFQKAGSRTLTSGKNRHASLTAAVEYTLAQQPPWENRFVSCLSLLPWPASTEMVEMLQREMPDKSDYDPHRVWGSPFRKGGAAERERTVPASLFQLEDAVKPELSRRLTDQERQEFDRLLVTCMAKILLTKGSEDRSFLKKEWENYKYCLGIDQRQSAPMLLRDAPKVIVGMAMWYPELVSDCARLTKGLLESLSKCPASIEKAECDARKAELWNNLGVCYQFAGRFEDAEKCLRDSADLWETLVVEKERQGEDARNARESIAKTNNSLGWVLHLKSIYREEVDTTALTHALTCFDRARRNSGADSERAACYSNRGVALFRQGRFSEAEAELANAVALLNAKVDELIRDCADRLGTRHSPDECEKLRIMHLAKIEHTARAYNRRVMVYLAQADQPGKTDDAKSDLRMCKGILDRTEDKSEICVMLNNMALFYLLTGKPLAAEEALRMIHVYQDVYDRAADVLQNNLGIAYVLQGNYSEAVAAFRRGRDRCRVDSAQPESSLHPKVIAANLEKAERFRIKAMKGMPLEVHTPKRGKGCGAPSVGCWRPRVEVAVGSVRFECLWRWAES